MITLLLLILPIVAGLVLLYSKDHKLGANLAIGLAIAEILLFFYGFIQGVSDFNILWLKEYDIKFHLGFDGLSLLMVGLTVTLIPFIIQTAKIFDYKNKNRLFALIFFTEAALIGVFTAKDIFVFYFFFEIALLPVYLIANFWGGKDASKITFKMLVYTIFGSLFMLVAFVILYMRGVTSDMEALKATVGMIPASIQTFVFWALLLAFSIKMPVFPLHTWLPDAYSESPTPATMLLSGLLSKMGVYGLIRILLPLAPTSLHDSAQIIILLSIVGLIYGSVIAIQQDNIKKLIAYSSFAHMGLMAGAVLTHSVSGLQGAIFQMIAHGFNAIGLFFVAKIIYDRTGSRSLNNLGGIAQVAPVFSVLFMIILLGSIALPLTSGFVGEFLMLKSIFDFNPIFGFLAGSSIVFGAVYMLRLFQKAIFGSMTNTIETFSDLSRAELFILVPISFIVIITGFFPSLILNISEPFVNSISGIIK